LLIVGAGEDEQRLTRLAAQAGVSERVVFAGMQPYSMLPDIIRSADVCINPFELNGITRNILPTKLFQYMACGKPVVATSLPGTQTFLRGEEDGIVYAPLADFNDQVSALLSDCARRMDLGGNASRAARRYEWDQIAETLATWLAEVAAS
jgi:glycosyltransferase involved in cell wall biosynthesis